MWLVLVHLKNPFHPSTNQRRKVKEKNQIYLLQETLFCYFFNRSVKQQPFPTSLSMLRVPP